MQGGQKCHEWKAPPWNVKVQRTNGNAKREGGLRCVRVVQRNTLPRKNVFGPEPVPMAQETSSHVYGLGGAWLGQKTESAVTTGSTSRKYKSQSVRLKRPWVG